MKLDRRIKKLSIFALDEKTLHLIHNYLFYAEVVVKSVLPILPIPIDERFNEAIQGSLAETDSDCLSNMKCRNRVSSILKEKLSALLTIEARNKLIEDHRLATSTIVSVLKNVRQISGGKSFSEISTDSLNALIEEQIGLAAVELRLSLTTQADPTPITWAHPMGVLASDHVGYLSYDLTSLPDDVYIELNKAIEARKLDSKANLQTTIYVYPLSPPKKHFDALESARFADDAILLKLELEEDKLPAVCKNYGYLSIQNPDITDWRLSPGSFATNPGALVGADGCELILPSNFALHEFNFYQVMGLPAGDVHLPIDPAAAGKVRPGFVNEYRLSFIPIGHALGQILYSMPLAPGESVNLAVIDWTRRDDAQRKEQTKLDEQIIHNEHRDRTISETVNAAIQEYQHGSSFMGGIAGSYGAALGASGIGAAIGLSGSLGGSTASSSGTRDIAATTVQNLSDNITQASSAMRELQSTVVVHSTQTEHEAIETRTVVNYNHSHSLTILYYEVVRHFRVVTEFVGRRPALLTNIHGGIANIVSPLIGRSHYEINWQVISDNRKLLEAALLDERYKEGFDIVARRLHRNFVAQIVGPPPKSEAPTDPPLAVGPELRFFVFEMKTGGWFAAEKGAVQMSASLYPGPKLKGGSLQHPDGIDLIRRFKHGSTTQISPGGSFTIGNRVNSFVGVLEENVGSVRWGDIDMIRINFHLTGDSRISFWHIKVTGIDVNGLPVVLYDEPYEDLTLTEDGDIHLPTKRPQPTPSSVRPAAEIEEDAKFLEFQEHLLNNRAHYERALRLGLTEAQRAFELAKLGVGSGVSLLEKVENRPLEVLGDYVAYSCVDGVWSDLIMNRLKALNLPEIPSVERLVTLPTRGVFSEAKLGHCNASEEIDNTRFWDWQQSPIPHMAPDIAATQPVTPQVMPQNGLQPTQFPQSLINIVNPPAAPDPQGMSSALTALTVANAFRDMSGITEVSSLLKKLSDNSVAIAGIAQKEASGGVGGGAAGNAGNITGGASTTGTTGGVGGNKNTGVTSNSTVSGGRNTSPQNVGEVNDLATGIRKQLPPAKANPLINQLYQSAVDKASDNDDNSSLFTNVVDINSGSELGITPQKVGIIDVKLRVFIPAEAVLIDLPLAGQVGYAGDNRDFSYDAGTARAEIWFGAICSFSEKNPIREKKIAFGTTHEYRKDDIVDVLGKPSWWRKIRTDPFLNIKAQPIREATQVVNNSTLKVTGQVDSQDFPNNFLQIPVLKAYLFLNGVIPLDPSAPAINLNIELDLIDSGGNITYRLKGEHDGFPAYELYIEKKRVYSYTPIDSGKSPLNLAPPMDVFVDTEWTALP